MKTKNPSGQRSRVQFADIANSVSTMLTQQMCVTFINSLEVLTSHQHATDEFLVFTVILLGLQILTINLTINR